MRFNKLSGIAAQPAKADKSAPNGLCQPNGVIRPIGTLAAPPPDEWCRSNRGRCILHPVGTRGAVGWMRGPDACPRGDETGWPHGTQTHRQATRTSTRPPPVSTSTPCPYRTEADIPNHSPIRLAKIIRCAVSVYDTLDILLKFIIASLRAQHVVSYTALGTEQELFVCCAQLGIAQQEEARVFLGKRTRLAN